MKLFHDMEGIMNSADDHPGLFENQGVMTGKVLLIIHHKHPA